MSTAEPSRATSSEKEAPRTNPPTSTVPLGSTKIPATPSNKLSHHDHISNPPDTRKAPARLDQPSESTTPSTPEDSRVSTRQVIAVSASKGPAAFFNLARKFLATDEEVDLSALEGAIVSAVDAAHLLERSQLATIVRVNTSYVSVEPKRRKAPPRESAESTSSIETVHHQIADVAMHVPSIQHIPRVRPLPGPSRELRRSRIIITMRRTESYKQWLEDNPLQAMASDEGSDPGDVEESVVVEGDITSP